MNYTLVKIHYDKYDGSSRNRFEKIDLVNIKSSSSKDGIQRLDQKLDGGARKYMLMRELLV